MFNSFIRDYNWVLLVIELGNFFYNHRREKVNFEVIIQKMGKDGMKGKSKK